MPDTVHTTPKPFCFVLMPFEPRFNDVYQIGIKEACAEAGAYCERVDEQIFQERILERIYNQIAKADCVIADMTGRNPNVYYEVGYAHALGKRTILITKNADDIPFDLRPFAHIVYGDSLVSLRSELARTVEYYINAPLSSGVLPSVAVRLSLNGQVLTPEGIDAPILGRSLWNSDYVITIENISNHVIDADQLKVGVLLSSNDSNLLGRIALSDGATLVMAEDIPRLFPQQAVRLGLQAWWWTGQRTLIVRVFSAQGPIDFPLHFPTATHEDVLPS